MDLEFDRRSELLKALANPTRLRIVHNLLNMGCHNVGCMEHVTGMSQSCISQHLQKLKAAGVVSSVRSGNEVYYKAASPEAARLVAALFQEEADRYVL